MQSEETILRHMLETTLAGYWDWHVQEDYVYLSPRFKEIFGYHDHEIANHPDDWHQLIFAEDLPTLKANFKEHVASRGEVPYRNQLRYHHKDDSTLWVLCQGKVVEWDEEGNPLRVVGNHIDITAQKQAEEALLHYQTALTSLKKIATTAYLSVDEQINAALVSVSNYLKLPLGIVSRIQDEVYEVVNVFVEELPVPIQKGQVFSLGHTYCSITCEAGRAIGMHQVGQSERAAHPCYIDMGLETYIGAPVRVREKVYGTVSFSSPSTRTRPFSQYDLEFIEILANWVGYSIEKREIREALELSQKKARAVFENSQDAIMLVDHDSLKIIDCNRMAVDLYELDGECELIGRRGIDFHKYLFTDEQHRGYRSLTRAGDSFSTEVEYVTKKGRKFWGNLSVFVFAMEDRLFQWVRVVDISEARQREQELQMVKEALSQQTEDLQAANEETRSINDSLEFMVRERTVTLEERNRQLADFAFLNAHKMRGPLARILGLVDILKYTDTREQEKELLQHIVQSARELDQVIKTAANTLVTPGYAESGTSSEE